MCEHALGNSNVVSLMSTYGGRGVMADSKTRHAAPQRFRLPWEYNQSNAEVMMTASARRGGRVSSVRHGSSKLRSRRQNHHTREASVGKELVTFRVYQAPHAER